MSINKLRAVLPPPTVTYEANNNLDWHDAEKKLGLTLPDDYKDFIQLYGTSIIYNYFWVMNPFASIEAQSLIENKYVRSHYQVLIEADSNFAYQLYPHIGGLLPCIDTNETCVMWVTKGLPNEWSLLWLDNYAEIIGLYQLQITEFLYQIVVGDIQNVYTSESLNDRDKPFMNPDEWVKYNHIKLP